MYEIEVGSHLIRFEDGVFECDECDMKERVPDIFYKDGAESVEKYKYYILGMMHRNPCTEAGIEGIIDDFGGDVTDVTAGGIVGDVTTKGGQTKTTMAGNSVVTVGGDKIHLQDGMPATYEDQQKLQKHVEVQQKQQEIRDRMGL